jgi:hypothetical protein
MVRGATVVDVVAPPTMARRVVRMLRGVADVVATVPPTMVSADVRMVRWSVTPRSVGETGVTRTGARTVGAEDGGVVTGGGFWPGLVCANDAALSVNVSKAPAARRRTRITG